jgi:hypothetical protein
MRVRGGKAIGFDGTIAGNDRLAHAGEVRPSPAATSGGGLDDRFAEALVEVLHQAPCAPIGHSEVAPGTGDRAGAGDGFQHRHFAGADAAAGGQVDAQADAVLGRKKRLAPGFWFGHARSETRGLCASKRLGTGGLGAAMVLFARTGAINEAT